MFWGCFGGLGAVLAPYGRPKSIYYVLQEFTTCGKSGHRSPIYILQLREEIE